MPLQPCAPQPFEGTQQALVPFGTTITQLDRIKANTWRMIVCARPCLPVWGLHENAAPLTGTYDFAPSTKGNENTLVLLAKACLEASENYINNVTALIGNNIYLPNDGGQNFGSYLKRKLPSSCLVNRYLEVYNKARQFFTLHAAIGAFTFGVYQELQVLLNEIMAQTDKQMLIPPGIYLFDGTAIATAFDNWLAADANLKNLYSIELITT